MKSFHRDKKLSYGHINMVFKSIFEIVLQDVFIFLLVLTCPNGKLMVLGVPLVYSMTIPNYMELGQSLSVTKVEEI